MRLSIALASVAALLVVGCGTTDPAADDGPQVVATTTQVGSIARELAGDAAEVTVLMQPGVEAHDFELTAAHAAALERADLVLISGAGLEEWLEDTIEASGGADRVRDLSQGVDLRMPSPDDEHQDEHGDEDGDDGHDEADGDHAHDPEGVDPHYWLTAPNAIRMVENARDALLELDVDAEGIEGRAAALIGRLDAADAEVRSLIGEIPEADRVVVTDHDALGYFLEEYGLTFGGSIFPSLDVSSEPSARQIEALVSDIRASGVRAIFTESSVNPTLARAIADEAGVRLVDEPIYTDSLGPAGSGADTLDGMLVHNARVIRDGLVGG
ncbi:MAG TPA: metal ABC transporter substrate-binding protein [Candidatus Angelobacter sp.]|nr:metal ABC transporter substrate-binding protein [Candidatus Angelobacter sp.]